MTNKHDFVLFLTTFLNRKDVERCWLDTTKFHSTKNKHCKCAYFDNLLFDYPSLIIPETLFLDTFRPTLLVKN